MRNIYKSYGEKTVLQDVTMSINAGDIIALVGENGVGKTTLLQVMLGVVVPDSGVVQRDRESVGYVPQEPILGRTIDTSFDASNELWRRDIALETVGLGDMPGQAQVGQLSGGQKTRLALAAVLAQDPAPTTLLLDEPTNNLDAKGLQWLEQFIRTFRGGTVLVSHDRAFINKVSTGIAELGDGKLRFYGGNYDFYREQKDREWAAEEQAYEEYVAEKRHIEQLIRIAKQGAVRNIHRNETSDNDKFAWGFKKEQVQGTRGRQAKALESRLEQLGGRARPESEKNYAVSLVGSIASTKLVLRLNGIQKSYQQTVLADINLEIRGGERIRVAGPNGSGKTTLLKIAAGLLLPDDGVVEVGTNVRVGYFSQDTDGIDYGQSGLENLQSTGADMSAIFRGARSLGLTKDDLLKLPAELSRGQQAKLGFAKLLISANELLILDEPTNHLDIPTRERIEVALQAYKGAILVASHDQYFIDKLNVTKACAL